MKLLATTALLLMSAATVTTAQVHYWDHWTQPVPEVTVTHVDASMAVQPGRVNILGRSLGLIRDVFVGGVSTPILFNDGTRIVIAPPAQDPGFGTLELVGGNNDIVRPIEFLPSLKARWSGNGLVRLALHAGEPGWYNVMFSFRRLGTPIQYPGIYYGAWLDMSIPRSGALFTGQVFGDTTVVFPPMRVPITGLLGAFKTMHVQAMCIGDNRCYSNYVTLRPTL